MCFMAIALCLFCGDWKGYNNYVSQHRSVWLKRTQRLSSNDRNSCSDLKKKENKLLHIKHEMSSSPDFAIM